jgi:hypothetical protein
MMLAFDALVRGRVIYVGAHDMPMRVPQGRCRVETHAGFVSLSWVDESEARTAVLKVDDFEEYLEAGALLVTDAAQIRRRPKVPKECA